MSKWTWNKPSGQPCTLTWHTQTPCWWALAGQRWCGCWHSCCWKSHDGSRATPAHPGSTSLSPFLAHCPVRGETWALVQNHCSHLDVQTLPGLNTFHYPHPCSGCSHSLEQGPEEGAGGILGLGHGTGSHGWALGVGEGGSSALPLHSLMEGVGSCPHWLVDRLHRLWEKKEQ